METNVMIKEKTNITEKVSIVVKDKNGNVKQKIESKS